MGIGLGFDDWGFGRWWGLWISGEGMGFCWGDLVVEGGLWLNRDASWRASIRFC